MEYTIQPGSLCYLPFWVIMDVIGVSDTPFIKGEVITSYQMQYGSPNGAVSVGVADVRIKDGLIVYKLPTHYLISESELAEWRARIADWILTG